jgi:EpsI family protein
VTTSGHISRRQTLIGLACAATAATAVAAAPRRTEDRLKGIKLNDLVPARIGPWSYGDTQSVVVARADDAFPTAGSDQLVARSYRADNAPTIMLLIAYGSTQGATLQLHRPETCYPGQGFKLSGFSEPGLALGPARIQARRFTATRDQRIERLVYWTRIANSFPLNTAGEYAAILGSVLSGMVPDGVLVRLSTLSSDTAQADAALGAFAAELVQSISPLGRRILLGAAIAGETAETDGARRG